MAGKIRLRWLSLWEDAGDGVWWIGGWGVIKLIFSFAALMKAGRTFFLVVYFLLNF